MDCRTLTYLFVALALLAPATVATNVNNANYQASDPTWHFDTDMQFTTGFTLTANPSDVASGDPNNLQSGDKVCSGATVTVNPTATTRWATPDFAAVSIYPTCGGGFCPAMINAGGVSSNRNIRWLAPATWNNHKSFGDSNDFSQDPSRHDQLLAAGGFDNEPVTYNNATGEFHAGKEGGASVFCKGTFQILDGATVKSTSDMPSVGSANFVVSGAGVHQIGTRLSGVDCFGVIEKHPTNKVDNPPWFYFYYFTHNAPSIPATVATTTVNINVQNAGGMCAMHETSVTASASLSDEDQIMVKVTMHNDGDAIRVTSVSGSNADYSVSAFPVGLCNVLGFPPSLCPASNGFNEDINPSNNKNLYVLVQRNPGASGGTTLTFHATTVSMACGGTSSCDDDVSLNGPITCAIDPSSLDYGTLEVAEFQVSCRDLANNPIACVGSNWFWADGLAGGFIEKDNTHALAYPTSPPGSSGTLRYQSGIALCLSDVNVGTPDYECEFIPPSATMNTSTSKFFDLNCFKEGSPREPDDADYDLTDGLTGSTSGSSTDGTDYNAPGSASSGKLRGFGTFNDAPDPVVGAVAFANIDVISGGGGNNSTGCDNPNGCGPGSEGSTKYCTIGSGSLNVYEGYYGWLGIKCGEFANETCNTVSWSVQPPSAATLSGSNVNGTFFQVTGSKGTSGSIVAVVDAEGHSCSKPFTVGDQQCVDVT